MTGKKPKGWGGCETGDEQKVKEAKEEVKECEGGSERGEEGGWVLVGGVSRGVGQGGVITFLLVRSSWKRRRRK